MRTTWLVVVIALLGGVRRAAAQCGRMRPGSSGSGPVIVPAEGTTLPPHPRIYVFDHDQQLLTAAIDYGVGEWRDATITRVGRDEHDAVWAIDLPATAGPIDVALHFARDDAAFRRVSYTLAASARVPRGTNRARVVDLESVPTDACDDTLSLPDDLGLRVDSDAIAYRLRWANRADRDDAINVIPVADVLHLDKYMTAAEIAIARCEVDALFADGTSQTLGTLKASHTDPRMWATFEARAPDVPVPRAPVSVAAIAPPVAASSSTAAIIAAFFAGVGAMLVGRRVARQRRRHAQARWDVAP